MQLTRRQIMKVAAAAAAGTLALPSCQFLRKSQPEVNRYRDRERRVLSRIGSDPNYRYSVVREFDTTLSQEPLTWNQKQNVKSRLRLVTALGMTLALQAMKEQESLRSFLLDGDRRDDLLYAPDASLNMNDLSPIDVSAILNLRESVNFIATAVMDVPPFIDMDMFGEGFVVANSDSGGCLNNANCSADSGCTDTLCYDHWCDDTNCDNQVCYDTRCFDNGCDNSTSCGDQSGTCTDDASCTNSASNCLVSFEDLAPELIIGLEEQLNAGPSMDFLVRVGDRAIPVETVLMKSIYDTVPLHHLPDN